VTEFFFRLTPDWVLRAVEAGGFDPTGHCSALNSLENRVYDLRLTDGSHVVAKFYRPGRWTREAILEEHRFLFDLREAEIPVCAPVAFSDGETLHEVEGILYAVWPRTGGRAPDELSDDQVSVLGRLVARIHNVGAAREMRARPRLSSQSHAREPLEALEEHGAVPPQYWRRYRDAVERVASTYDELCRGVPVHRIHGDCHLGNLLYGREGYFFLDFDDCRVGPAVQDVWMLIPGRDHDAARQRDIMIDAYRQFREFDPRWLRLVEPLRALRFVHYAAWIARRFEDPAFPDAFPHFGTEEYWERETLDLEDQLTRIGSRVEGLSRDPAAPATEQEEVLTNKDFFWDLDEC
jgi:Ser/Thr protein kinase RdoA (MazF antagonist)